jgi:protein-S-isoprenylcysteine O-methyltransferase Ste14
MRSNPGFLYLALVVFLASSMAILLSLEWKSPSLALGGAFGNVLAGVLFLLSVWLPRRKVDWDRIQAEQRLWESGPLGRKWLRVRRRIYRHWKL